MGRSRGLHRNGRGIYALSSARRFLYRGIRLRRTQRTKVHRHGPGIGIAEPERRHPGFRLHRLRVPHPPIDPCPVQSESCAVERRSDLAALCAKAVASVTAILVLIEPLAEFHHLRNLLRFHSEIWPGYARPLSWSRREIIQRGLRSIEFFFRLRHGC